jgi:hypothetical protein
MAPIPFEGSKFSGLLTILFANSRNISIDTWFSHIYGTPKIVETHILSHRERIFEIFLCFPTNPTKCDDLQLIEIETRNSDIKKVTVQHPSIRSQPSD